jgi:hypothetical protein
VGVDADRRAKKLGRNEVLFRQVNERLRELGESFSVVAEKADFVCECSDERCAEQIELTLEEYERVRSDSTWFVIIREHIRPEVESIAWEIGGRLVVVQKPEELAADAVADDPRR